MIPEKSIFLRTISLSKREITSQPFQDIFEAASLEKIAEDLGESLLMYLPLDTKPNLDEIPAIPSLPSLIPIRVG